MNFLRILIWVPAILLGTTHVLGQATSRIGSAEGVEFHQPALRTVPCNGDSLFREDFENGIPATFTILDLDNKDPRSILGLGKGWQDRIDYNDTANGVAVSPSWYEAPGQSDDWLITPQITLGANSCLSFGAYSQDRFFAEAYEVRISTTTPDTIGFFAHPALDSTTAESGDYDYTAISLAAYANQSVYIAFRQVSDDKFVLVLDEILVADVAMVDAGVFDFAPANTNPGDTILISGEFANYGTDTLTSVDVVYSIDGGPTNIKRMDSLSVPPNETFEFSHDSLWATDTLDRFYTVCFWTTNPNGTTDERFGNDTLCKKIGIGTPIGVEEPVALPTFVVFPNPATSRLKIRLNDQFNWRKVNLKLVDLSGKTILNQEADAYSGTFDLALPSVPAGIYFLQIHDDQGKSATQKVLIQ